jgi:predicted XRE-type DNA-binding protein
MSDFSYCDNILVDLGFDPAEAAVLQMRANLMSDLRLYIDKHRLTQSEAAKRLGIAQSRVSDLVRGKWDKFSLEMLITFEARIGRMVRMSSPRDACDANDVQLFVK